MPAQPRDDRRLPDAVASSMPVTTFPQGWVMEVCKRLSPPVIGRPAVARIFVAPWRYDVMEATALVGESPGGRAWTLN
jgi:hypothetical protein